MSARPDYTIEVYREGDGWRVELTGRKSSIEGTALVSDGDEMTSALGHAGFAIEMEHVARGQALASAPAVESALRRQWAPGNRRSIRDLVRRRT